jgi:hypothetical protein
MSALLVKKAVALLSIVATLLCITYISLGQVAVLVTSIPLQIPAGESSKVSFPIENVGKDEPATLTLYLGDWSQEGDGDRQYLPAETLSNSCAEWIELSRTQLELPAGESTDVSFTVTVPSGAAGSYWAVLFIQIEPGPVTTEAPETETGRVVGIREVWRQAVLIYQTVPGTEEPDATIGSLRARADRNTGLVNIDLEFENTGNTILRDVVGSIDLIDQTGEVADTVAIPKFMILPGSTRTFELTSSKKLAPGVYIARAGIDYGEALASAQRAFMVKK